MNHLHRHSGQITEVYVYYYSRKVHKVRRPGQNPGKKTTLKGGIEKDELAENREKQLESRRETRRV